MTSKIDPRGDTFDQKGSKNLRPLPTGPFLESTFFRAACFLCFLIHFRRPFSQCWALLAPFGPFWGPCWSLLAPFWQLFGRSWLIFARNKKNLESIFAGGFFTKNLVAKRIKESKLAPYSQTPPTLPKRSSVIVYHTPCSFRGSAGRAEPYKFKAFWSFFSKNCMRPRIRSLSTYLPKRPLRDKFRYLAD